MGRTALGTATKTSGTTVTLASVALAAGETIIVLTTINDGGCMGVTWNGEALTQAVQSTQLNAMCTAGIFYKKITAGATGSVVATFDRRAMPRSPCSSTHPADCAARQDRGRRRRGQHRSELRQHGHDRAGRRVPDRVRRVAGPSTVTARRGSTASRRGNGRAQRGAALDSTVCEGYRTVAATGAYSAAATLGTARDWAAAIATFKIAVAQTSTPHRSMSPPWRTSPPAFRPASSAPASHAVPVVANNAPPSSEPAW